MTCKTAFQYGHDRLMRAGSAALIPGRSYGAGYLTDIIFFMRVEYTVELLRIQL